MNTTIDQVKKAIEAKKFNIPIERYTQDITINTKLVFSNSTRNRTLPFTSRDLDYIKEVDRLLNIIYIKEQGGVINPNFPVIIYNLHTIDNMFPLLYKKIFENKPVSIEYWSKEEICQSIEEYIYYDSELCNWDAKNGHDSLLGYTITVEYPKIILELENDPLDAKKVSVSNYYGNK